MYENGRATKMKVVLYANGASIAEKRFRNAIQEVVTNDHLETFSTMACLCLSLRQPVQKPTIAVLLANSKEELNEIYSMKDLLREICIILLLPDSKRDTMELAFKIGARFLSHVEADCKDVVALLSKIQDCMICEAAIPNSYFMCTSF